MHNPQTWQGKPFIRNAETKQCLTCGTTFGRGDRLHRKNGRTYVYKEQMKDFLKRKFCSKECRVTYRKEHPLLGEYNANYKGIMPKCIDCGKKVGYRKRSNGDDKCTPCERCKSCFKKWAKETNYYQKSPQLQKLIKKAKEGRGIQPKQLIPFAFKVGHPAYNKITTTIKCYVPIRVRTGLMDSFKDIRATKEEARWVKRWRYKYNERRFKYKVVEIKLSYKPPK